MKRRFPFAAWEVALSLAVVVTLVVLSLPIANASLAAFLKSLPWNP